MFLRLFGLCLGFICSDALMHFYKTHAYGLAAETLPQRLGAIFFGFISLVIVLFVIYRLFPPSFFNGFVVATGLFLSFDIVVFHWIFVLHRITSGPEADILEPILVIAGLILLWIGFYNEKIKKK